MRRDKQHCVCEKKGHVWKWLVCKTPGLMTPSPFNNWHGKEPSCQQTLAAVLENRVREPFPAAGPVPLVAGLLGSPGAVAGWLEVSAQGAHGGLGGAVFADGSAVWLHPSVPAKCPIQTEGGVGGKNPKQGPGPPGPPGRS